jgi:predicted small secreted protein
MNRKMILLPVLFGLACLAGCNTIAGIGQDLQAGGRALAAASDEVADAVTRPHTSTTASAETCDRGGDELKGRSSQPDCR